MIPSAAARLTSDVASVAIVGYTNAGKSSLLNALTGAGVLVENALFATLEPTTRRGQLDDGRQVASLTRWVSSGTFPPSWWRLSARRWRRWSTPDLLVHVVDGSDVNPMAQIPKRWWKVVREVQSEHNAPLAPELLVVNKIDAASDLMLAQLRRALPGAVFVSAHSGGARPIANAHRSIA